MTCVRTRVLFLDTLAGVGHDQKSVNSKRIERGVLSLERIRVL